ncbi:MAG: hypothetical protein LBF78_06635, partial [Treponema sp.]|nr:hypothetical protein [Treponema sp.]
MSVPIPGLLLPAAALALADSAISLDIYRLVTVFPLKKAWAAMEKNAAGDLSHPVAATAAGAPGRAILLFNTLADTLRQLVMTVETEGENLDDVGFELSSRMGDTARAVDGIGAAVEAIRERTRLQSASTQKTNAAMEQM